MSTRDHLPLAPRDLLILAVLAEGPQHGYGIIKSVEARSESGVLLDPANLYRVLRRMRRMGWIEETARAQAPAGSVGGPRESHANRRTYVITPGGKALLSAELVRLERLLRQVRPAMAGRDGG